MAEPLAPVLSSFEDTTEKLKRYKSPGIAQILAEPIQAGGNTLHSENHKQTNKQTCTYKISSNIVSRLTSYIYETTAKCKCTLQ
jgi:hypothetical protein